MAGEENDRVQGEGQEGGVHVQPTTRQNGRPAVQATRYKCQTCTPKTRGRRELQETKAGGRGQQTRLQTFLTFLTLEDVIKKLLFKTVLKTYLKIGL